MKKSHNLQTVTLQKSNNMFLEEKNESLKTEALSEEIKEINDSQKEFTFVFPTNQEVNDQKEEVIPTFNFSLNLGLDNTNGESKRTSPYRKKIKRQKIDRNLKWQTGDVELIIDSPFELLELENEEGPERKKFSPNRKFKVKRNRPDAQNITIRFCESLGDG